MVLIFYILPWVSIFLFVSWRKVSTVPDAASPSFTHRKRQSGHFPCSIDVSSIFLSSFGGKLQENHSEANKWINNLLNPEYCIKYNTNLTHYYFMAHSPPTFCMAYNTLLSVSQIPLLFPFVTLLPGLQLSLTNLICPNDILTELSLFYLSIYLYTMLLWT